MTSSSEAGCPSSSVSASCSVSAEGAAEGDGDGAGAVEAAGDGEGAGVGSGDGTVEGVGAGVEDGTGDGDIESTGVGVGAETGSALSSALCNGRMASCAAETVACAAGLGPGDACPPFGTAGAENPGGCGSAPFTMLDAGMLLSSVLNGNMTHASNTRSVTAITMTPERTVLFFSGRWVDLIFKTPLFCFCNSLIVRFSLSCPAPKSRCAYVLSVYLKVAL